MMVINNKINMQHEAVLQDNIVATRELEIRICYLDGVKMIEDDIRNHSNRLPF